MIALGNILLAVYLATTIGVLIMYALCIFDLKKFCKEKLKEGVRFKSYSRAENIGVWIRLITSAFLPIWNFLILHILVWQTERILDNAKRNLMKQAIEE